MRQIVLCTRIIGCCRLPTGGRACQKLIRVMEYGLRCVNVDPSNAVKRRVIGLPMAAIEADLPLVGTNNSVFDSPSRYRPRNTAGDNTPNQSLQYRAYSFGAQTVAFDPRISMARKHSDVDVQMVDDFCTPERHRKPCHPDILIIHKEKTEHKRDPVPEDGLPLQCFRSKLVVRTQQARKHRFESV
jgi:hypothetical protein